MKNQYFRPEFQKKYFKDQGMVKCQVKSIDQRYLNQRRHCIQKDKYEKVLTELTNLYKTIGEEGMWHWQTSYKISV